jgi:hypothetical protein
MTFDDKILWDWFVHQDDIIMSRFEIGIVGIGALLFAYGSVHNFGLQAIIALVGFGGSAILSMNIFGSLKDMDVLSNSQGGILREGNEDFFQKFDRMKEWRKTCCWYKPVTKLMAYFMLLVAFAWLVILGFLLFQFLFFWFMTGKF